MLLEHGLTPHERQITTHEPGFIPHELPVIAAWSEPSDTGCSGREDNQISLSKFHTTRVHDSAQCMPLPFPADLIAG